MSTINLIILAITGAAGIFFGIKTAASRFDATRDKHQKEAKEIYNAAKREAEVILSKAKDNVLELRSKIHDLDKSAQENTANLRKRVELKEQNYKKRQRRNDQKEEALKEVQSDYNDLLEKSKELLHKAEELLLTKTGMDLEQAKKKVSNDLDREFEKFVQKYIAKTEQIAKENSHKKATNLIRTVIEKFTDASSVERPDRSIKVPKDDFKGDLIGKNSENIKYLEELTETDIVFDDQPKMVSVSCFNLVKQETARLTIKNLFKAKEINKKSIDSAYKKAKEQMDEKLFKAGSKAAELMGVENKDPELIRTIGRLKYRTSYGQNQLYHSIEVAYFCQMLAAQIGADVHVAKMAGFFHDLGKAIDQELNESHDVLSKKLLEKYGYSDDIIHAAWRHHNAAPPETVEAWLVQTADAISGSRPGARSESAEQYYERVQNLEKFAMDTKGVRKAFAMSGGREIRAFLDESDIKDEDMPKVAKKLAGQIEENLAYPGKIKVNMIRILKAVDFANKETKSKKSKKT